MTASTPTPTACPKEASGKAAAKARDALDDVDAALDRIMAVIAHIETTERSRDRRPH